jgi:hypothetical protein
MKHFAQSLLADSLPREQVLKLDPRDIECKCRNFKYLFGLVFANNLCYVIKRELDLVSHPELNFTALTKDGVFGKLT